MSTQQRPELNEQSPSLEPGESQQPETPPTNNQGATPTEPILINGRTPEEHARYVSLLEATLREQNARVQQFEDSAARGTVAPAPTPAPQKSPAELNQEWYNRPAELTREIVGQEIGNLREDFRKTIEPLLDFARGMRGEGTPFNSILNRLKADPRFANAQITPDVEAAAQDILRNNRAEINDQNVMAAIVQAQGLKSMNMLVGYSSVPAIPTQNPQPPMSTPAHLRPSAPPGPRQQNTAADEMKRKIDGLSENERRIVREQFGGKAEDYIKFRDSAGNDNVSFSSYTTGSQT